MKVLGTYDTRVPITLGISLVQSRHGRFFRRSRMDYIRGLYGTSVKYIKVGWDGARNAEKASEGVMRQNNKNAHLANSEDTSLGVQACSPLEIGKSPR